MEREWYIDGEPLVALTSNSEMEPADNVRVAISDNKDTVIVSNMDEMSVGIYTCKVSQKNLKTVSEENIEEEVQVIQPLMEVSHLLGTAPIIDEDKQEDIIVLEGENVIIKCNIIGNPTPSKIWHKV